jgi:hypothetical protein
MGKAHDALEINVVAFVQLAVVGMYHTYPGASANDLIEPTRETGLRLSRFESLLC